MESFHEMDKGSEVCHKCGPASFAERTTRPLDVRELAAKASSCLRKVRFGCINQHRSTVIYTCRSCVGNTFHHITMPFVGKSRMPVLKNKENYYLMALYHLHHPTPSPTKSLMMKLSNNSPTGYLIQKTHNEYESPRKCTDGHFTLLCFSLQTSRVP